MMKAVDFIENQAKNKINSKEITIVQESPKEGNQYIIKLASCIIIWLNRIQHGNPWNGSKAVGRFKERNEQAS